MLQRILRPLGVVLAALATTTILPAQDAAAARSQEPAAVKKHESPKHAFIWKIEKEGLATSYLFGTMHGPDPRFTKFNDTVKKAFKEADAVYTELDMDSLASSETASKFAQLGQLPAGKKISDYLSEEYLGKLEKVATELGAPLPYFLGLRPFFISLNLEQFSMAKHMGGGDALDAKIWKAAVRAKKEVGGIETLDEQLEALTVLTDQEGAKALEKQLDMTLGDLKTGRVRIMEMAEHYLSGDSKQMMDFINETSDPNDPIEAKFMYALIDKRNFKMADRSAARMIENPDKSYVFVFGTLHFIGSNPVGELLEKKGFKVTRLTAPPAKPVKQAAEAAKK